MHAKATKRGPAKMKSGEPDAAPERTEGSPVAATVRTAHARQRAPLLTSAGIRVSRPVLRSSTSPQSAARRIERQPPSEQTPMLNSCCSGLSKRKAMAARDEVLALVSHDLQGLLAAHKLFLTKTWLRFGANAAGRCAVVSLRRLDGIERNRRRRH
jgi:hypothetical protein